MTAEIVHLNVPTTVEHRPDDILERAKGQGIDTVLVIGQRDGKSGWFSGSTSDVEKVVFMLEWAKRFIMDSVREQDADLDEGEAS